MIPFYRYWDIFQKEPEQIKSSLTFFWGITIPLSVTTGTLNFLEVAIQRWPTICTPKAPSLQSSEEIKLELQDITKYRNNDAYRTSWEEWIHSGKEHTDALSILAKNGLFRENLADQRKGANSKANAEQNKCGKGNKRPRSSSHANLPAYRSQPSQNWQNTDAWQHSQQYQQDWQRNSENWQYNWSNLMATSQQQDNAPSTSSSSQQWSRSFPAPQTTQHSSHGSGGNTNTPGPPTHRSRSSANLRRGHPSQDRLYQ